MTTVISRDDLRPRPDDDSGAGGALGDEPSGPRPGLGVGTEQLALAGVVIVAMTVIATIGFGTIFSSNSFLLVALVGATLGALVVVFGRRMNLLFGEIVGIGLIAPLVVGPIAAGGTGFYQGLVLGWADILSATPPVDATPALKALPFIASFAGALVATELFRIRELPGLAVVGPIGTLTLTALFSEQTRTGAIAVGLVLLIGMLVLARLHYAAVSSTGLLVLGLVLGLVAALASMASVLLPYADEERRFDLRDLQTPPWDPLSVPSPLTNVKAGLLAFNDTEQPVLRVRGDVAMDRWRLASLPAYGGVFWGVSEPNETADFVAVDSFLPEIEDEARSGDELRFDVDILQATGPWLPVAGVPRRVVFGDVTDARMSLETGTLGLPDGLQPGNSYELDVTPFVELDDDELMAHRFVAAPQAEIELLPPVVRNLAADFSTGIDQLSGERVLAIRDKLRLGSYSLTEPLGHTLDRTGSFLQVVQVGQAVPDEVALRPLVGFEEIYTASGALMMRLSDLPVRVAVGYVVPPERWVDRSAEIFASDINAWVEVHIEGQGWMPVDVTPERDRQPEEVEEQLDTAEAPFAEAPESPPSSEEEEPPEIEEPEEEEDEPEEEEDEPEDEVVLGLTPLRLAVGGAAAGLGSLLALGGAIFVYKAWRRRRRRNAERADLRISGAWAELVDRIDEAGGELPSRSTPAEAAAAAASMPVLGEGVETQVRRLADHVTVAAFHPVPPSDEAAADAWQAYDDVVEAMNKAAGPGGRVRRAVDPRTLRKPETAGAR